MHKSTRQRHRLFSSLMSMLVVLFAHVESSLAQEQSLFQTEVGPLLGRRCLGCHNNVDPKGGLSLSTRERALEGGENGPSIVAGDESASWLLDMISGDKPGMPKDADKLSEEQIELVRQWIREGAEWPEGVTLEEPAVQDRDWWSLRPMQEPAVPEVTAEEKSWVRTPIDAFVLSKLKSQGLLPSPPADRRTLVRRLYFDLLGLPPTPAQIEAFLTDTRPLAYERLVDQLLESPHYGERWARHWLDVVHYGDTHGYDKDKLRLNAWPYRDYVIRSFNEDKPFERFVREQIAGDVLWPYSRDGIEAVGFIAAGPWDFIGHAEVAEEKIDGQVARNLDRDDIVSSTLNTFMSTTVQCARCHNHKFDPITQEHYYGLQAVFAALDRADRTYDIDSSVAQRRVVLASQLQRLQEAQTATDKRIAELGGAALAEVDHAIARAKQRMEGKESAEFGYHSQIEASPGVAKWVQIDLGESRLLREVVLIGAHDDFNGIGAGFGFPVRYKVEMGDDPSFQSGAIMVADVTQVDQPNPGVRPQVISAPDHPARFIRITATQLAPRSNDYIFALAEVRLLDADGRNMARGATITSLDSIEAPPRWQQVNLVDDIHPGTRLGDDITRELTLLEQQRLDLIQRTVPDPLQREREEQSRAIQQVRSEIEKLSPQSQAYVGMVHTGSGAFQGRGHVGGKPRDIHILHRGVVTSRGALVGPGTIPFIEGVDWRFDIAAEAAEGERRVALANWLVRHDNPLTWRSIVNRIWLYHFGNGIVGTPNDFGRMGEKPSHPELLDWLATHFRDEGQSIKSLHRWIVNSSTYQQSSAMNEQFAAIDGDNRYLWRMNRRGLEAEVVRDSVLMISGKLDLRMYGPAFQDFVLERPEHSPHYEYHKHDPDDPVTHRRSIYRFLVRSQQQPFMQTLDCADPSQSVAKRDTTVTAIQALTMMNNRFMVRMSEHFADRVAAHATDVQGQVSLAFEWATGRAPTANEIDTLVTFAQTHGLENTCRLILNLNEFMFVD